MNRIHSTSNKQYQLNSIFGAGSNLFSLLKTFKPFPTLSQPTPYNTGLQSLSGTNEAFFKNQYKYIIPFLSKKIFHRIKHFYKFALCF